MKFHFSRGRTKMHLAQLRAALLILCLWTLTNLSFGCNDIYPQTMHLKVHEPLIVPCPNATEDEMTFKLSFNKHQICNRTFNGSHFKHQNAVEMGVDLKVNHRNREAHFEISSVQANSTGIYGCEAEVLFPPPYRKLTARLIAVFVEEERCQPQGIKQCPSESPPTFFWWPIGYGILGFYCLAMTCITAVLWHKLKIKQCLQNDYMNMKPGGFRKRPRVQHPAIMGRY
ncbi:T-cell-specific surface glycoprotein CD28 [Paramormyrops kingsleyae]|uniref:T-cell-specific surface glycoprotein CD28-like n=1 Tax=Paramormyrops kingsleyae TaxID=1676925 RepID=A0A3B3RGF6_9TELE|nr:T-cell-specific surface glycoprotein CD28-like isoform X1 [Paramormyrops kingsleyae]